jgi:hypothetical protein
MFLVINCAKNSRQHFGVPPTSNNNLPPISNVNAARLVRFPFPVDIASALAGRTLDGS